MWTCGIDIATQQQTDATQRSTCNEKKERPNAPVALLRATAFATVRASGARPRMPIKPMSTIAAPLAMPIPACVLRQPTEAIKCCTTGDHTVPAT
jgi:hypothetical protein